MSVALLFAFGAMAAYVVLGLLHKYADRAKCRPRHITIFLFGWSAVFSLLTLLATGQHPLPPFSVWRIAGPSGACAATAILLFQIGVRQGKIASSWLIVNLSAGIPILVSILFYGEQVGVKKLFAIVAMLASLILLWLEKRNQEGTA